MSKYYTVYYYKHQLNEGFNSKIASLGEKITEDDVERITDDIIFNFSMRGLKITDLAIINMIKLDE